MCFKTGWTKNPSNGMILAYTTESIISLRLPASIDPTTKFHIVVSIRDKFDCVREFQLQLVTVFSDESAIKHFLDILQKPYNYSNDDPIWQLIVSKDQNIVGQMITSISQIFTEMNYQMIQNAAQSKQIFFENEYKF